MDTQSDFVPDWTPTAEDRDDDAGFVFERLYSERGPDLLESCDHLTQSGAAGHTQTAAYEQLA